MHEALTEEAVEAFFERFERAKVSGVTAFTYTFDITLRAFDVWVDDDEAAPRLVEIEEEPEVDWLEWGSVAPEIEGGPEHYWSNEGEALMDIGEIAAHDAELDDVLRRAGCSMTACAGSTLVLTGWTLLLLTLLLLLLKRGAA